ncbi:MAG: sn-glycerol-3-phosphate ABC transporter ATP-binding protein UgpC [Rhizobiaceae bacterium]|nr:sn-glycerol-3-phosphate ABC transporter ATP-binding protein UgpC [Rhizobiaceae bacterium]MCV0408304.1 sn-glycerol-3-phosphate ABC transporter ATP-binding protein UgpC [Rhizobiaceae bacterium]
MAVVELEGLVKDYGDVRAIHGVDLRIEDGEFCVFVGPSGCGKSTLLRMIAGLEEISGGELRIEGERVNEQRASERGLAMVFQTYALYPHMTVRQNLAFGLENIKTPKAEIERRVGEAARMLQIEDYLERRPKQLSGGQRQRVAIGRAVVREPSVFLFDEPLSNLDAELRVTMRGEIAGLHRRLGNTMIYVTHDQIEAMTMADKIVVLRAGVIEQAGTPLELYNMPRNEFVAGFIGSPRMNFVDAVIDSTAGDFVTVRDASGNRHKTAVDAHGLSEGEEVRLGIRPDHIVVDSEGSGLSVTVGSVEQLGGESYIYCEAAEGTFLTVHLDGQTKIRRGDEARVVFRPEFTHLFRKSDGLAQRRLVVGEAV